MAESYSVKAKLSAVDSGFSSTLNKAANTISSIDKKISGLSFGFLTGAGMAAFNALTNGAKSLISEIDSSNATWKTFAGNMKIIGKGEGEINSVKKELQSFAETTVYSSSDMASTYAQLAAVGTKNTSKLVKGFGGLAAAAENPQQAMKTLSQQGTQMAAKPTVAWQDFKLMLEQTPAGMAAVAKEMGMTSSELVTAIQDGEIATDDFFDAIQRVGNSKSFQKLATQPKTVGQAMDGLKETVANKLTPAFDVLSQKGIGAVNKIADSLSKIDASKFADKISSALEKAQKYWDALTSAFSGVGTEVWGALKEIGNAITGTFGSTDSVESFKSTMQSVANVIKSIAKFAKDNAAAIGTLIKWLPAIAIGLKGFSIAKAVAPGVMTFAKGITGLASKGIGGIAGKLFGISKAQKTVGDSSAASGSQMLQSAGAFALMGAAVLMIAGGFALLAFSAIALANAGGAAIAVMVVMTAALVGLMIGMMVMLKSMASFSAGMIPAAAAMLMLGAAIMLVSVGFAILAQTAISLAAAGAPAILVMFGLVASVALLAAVFALLGPALTAGAVGFIAFGAAVLMAGAGMALMGVGALLAAMSLQIIAAVLPLIVQNALQGAIAIVTLGSALVIFAVGAALAGAACLVLAAGVLVLGAGMLMLGLGAILAGAGLAIISAILPKLVEYGAQGALAIVTLGSALAIFSIGAALAGAAAIILGAGLLVCSAAVLVLCAGALVLAAAVLVLSVGALIASAALAVLSSILPTLATYGTAGAAAITALGGALLIFAAGAIAAGIGAAGAAIAMAAFGIAIAASAIGMAAMALALVAVNSRMKSIAKNAKSTQKSLKAMQKSVKSVENGLKAMGEKAKSAMKGLLSAFDNTASKVKSAGKKVGNGFASGMQAGLAKAAAVAFTITTLVTATFNAGRAKAYSAGAYFSAGFAGGMLSQLGVIQSAAAKMAAAADKAVRAKAKIQSPSKVSEQLGNYWGAGLVNGIDDMVRKVWEAAQNLIAIPEVATPNLAMAYSGEFAADYDYYRNSEYIIEVPLSVDGKEFARANATYMQDELDRKQTRDRRKHGKV